MYCFLFGSKLVRFSKFYMLCCTNTLITHLFVLHIYPCFFKDRSSHSRFCFWWKLAGLRGRSSDLARMFRPFESLWPSVFVLNSSFILSLRVLIGAADFFKIHLSWSLLPINNLLYRDFIYEKHPDWHRNKKYFKQLFHDGLPMRSAQRSSELRVCQLQLRCQINEKWGFISLGITNIWQRCHSGVGGRYDALFSYRYIADVEGEE